MTAYLRGPAYVLGETESDYTAIGNVAELAERYGLAPRPALWGWGGVRVSRRDLADLAADAATAALRAAGLTPAGVSALVVCTNRIAGPAEGHGRFVQRLLTGAGLGDLPCYGVNLNRCVNLLAGLDVARALVLSGRHERILVITADILAPGADRMAPYALFSDGAAACVVAADPGSADPGSADHGSADHGPADSYELLGCATAQDAATLEWTCEISSDLARAVTDELLGAAGLKLGEVAALLHANIFTPLVMMKERQAGFTAEQLYLDNIPRIGHCFAADPLINLVDRAAAGHLPPGAYALLAASVPGSRIGALLRRAA
jgi:3-oxoacyl-[acyl-carrier-protein] synthase III